MQKIVDNGRESKAEIVIEPSLTSLNYKKLPNEDAKCHLSMFSGVLHTFSREMYDKLPKLGGTNNNLQLFIHRLATSLELLVQKYAIDAEQIGDAARFECVVDPSDSGYPLVARDFCFLRDDKQKSAEILAGLPSHADLVEQFLFSAFRGRYAGKVLFNELIRQYHEKLSGIELPSEHGAHAELKSEGKDGIYYLKSIERLDGNNNLPKFYTFELRVPTGFSKDAWTKPFEDEVKRIFTTTFSMPALELKFLAETLETIEGIQLLKLERYDIGPFCNRFTHNDEHVSTILRLSHEQNDFVFLFRKYDVVRMGEKREGGLLRWLKHKTKIDCDKGYFSPPIQSPQYMIMPHRLIQMIHASNLNLGENVKMYGITQGGDLVD